jgi:hypothetical protein
LLADACLKVVTTGIQIPRHELAHGALDTDLPQGTPGPHLDLEPEPPAPRAPRVRDLLQPASPAPSSGPSRSAPTTPPTDRRTSTDQTSGSPSTGPTQRSPPRVPTCRMTRPDDLSAPAMIPVVHEAQPGTRLLRATIKTLAVPPSSQSAVLRCGDPACACRHAAKMSLSSPYGDANSRGDCRAGRARAGRCAVPLAR